MEKIIINGAAIYYRKEGSGEPLVLLHGFGEDHEVFNQLVDNLSKEFLVITPDLPGSGKSERIPAAQTLTQLADVLNNIIENEKIEKFTLIGHSMGGYITLAYAEKYSGKLNKFGLFHSTALADSEEKKAARQKSIRFIETAGASKFMEEIIPGLFSEETNEKHSELVKKTLKKYINFHPDSLIQYYRMMIERPDRTGVLKESTVPVMFIFGEHDNLIPLNKGLELVKLPEYSYLEICKNSGHMGMLEEPEKCFEAIREFLYS